MILETIWFFLWGLLWAVFFVTGGFDLGVGILLPFVAKTDDERRIAINAIGPLWDGNEVWLITAGGVTFAAFPKVYAVMFSALYTPLLLILFALIFRGVSFEFRQKVANETWKHLWDLSIFFGSLLAALLLGVAFGNIFAGIPIDGRGVFQGNLLSLLNPYGILAGLLFVLFFMVHGAIWLCIRTTGEMAARAEKYVSNLWPVLAGVLVLFLIGSAGMTNLFDNYISNPVFFLILIPAVLGLLGIKIYSSQKRFIAAFLSSGLAIIFSTFFGIAGLYPDMFPSSIDPAYSLSAHNAAASSRTLTIMLVVVLIFIPVVIAYQFWAYRLFSDKVTKKDLAYDESY